MDASDERRHQGGLESAVEDPMGGRTARWADLVGLVRVAEAVGFDSVWVPDHLQVTWAEHAQDACECWTVLSALAASTTRMTPGSLVSPTGWRGRLRPALALPLIPVEVTSPTS